MFNPFAIYSPKLLQYCLDNGRKYLVTQTNLHAPTDAGGAVPLLVSDYNDPGLAQIHFKALEDRYAAILDLGKRTHLAKIRQLMEPDSGYHLYAAFIHDRKQVEREMNERFTDHIRNYVTKETNWRIGADKKISPRLELIFGELFVTLKYGSQRLRIKLAELEKYANVL